MHFQYTINRLNCNSFYFIRLTDGYTGINFKREMDREEQMGGAPYPIPCTEDTPYHLPSPMILSANVELLEGHDIFDENSNLKRQLRMKDSENKVLKVTINLLEMQLQAQGCSRLNGNSSQAAEHQTEGFGVAGTQVDTAEFMHPDARIFLADNAGMGEIRQGPEIENPLLMSTPNMSFSEAYSGLHAEASVSGGANLTWQRELAPSRSETGESMLTKDTYHVLIQELRFQQTHIKNQGQKLKCAESEIHNMLTQLNYGKKCVQDKTNEIEKQKWENKKLLEKVGCIFVYVYFFAFLEKKNVEARGQ